jgi:lipoprotein-anchoring transpeptidase ErfK/SrfK
LCLNARVQLYTRYRPSRRRLSVIRFFGPLVIVALALYFWLHWEPKKKEPPRIAAAMGRADARGKTPTVAKASTPLPTVLGSLTNLLHSEPTQRASDVSQPGATNGSASRPPDSLFPPRPAQSLFEAQLALARLGFSPGAIDGVLGSKTASALRAFQQRNNLPSTGELDAATRTKLLLTAPPYTNYVVTTNDLARLRMLGTTWLEKSRQDRLDYESVLELVAEKTWASTNLVRRLNASVEWTNVVAGTSITGPNILAPEVRGKAAFVRIQLAERTLQAFDESTNLLAHFPCSIAGQVDKRPVGELHVEVIVPNPDYTFDPDNFPESPEARQLKTKLVLKPGPNNPVGTAWIGLNRPGYGIHGTPRPELVGRAESHGCFRLVNWNAERLLELAWVGMPVYVEP